VKSTLETGGEDVKYTLETSGEDVKSTLETSGEDNVQGFDHITRLKDVKEVKFLKSGGHVICPVSKRELDDGVRR
jgi:hypothetical protein